MDVASTHILFLMVFVCEFCVFENYKFCNTHIDSSKFVEIEIKKLTSVKNVDILARFQTKDGEYVLKNIVYINILAKYVCDDFQLSVIGFNKSRTYSLGKGIKGYKIPRVTIFTEPHVRVGYIIERSTCHGSKNHSCITTWRYHLPNGRYPTPMFSFSYKNIEFWSNHRDEYLISSKWMDRMEIETFGETFNSSWLSKLNIKNLKMLKITGNDWGNIQVVLPPFPSLRSLLLPNNNIATLPEDFFGNIQGLRELEIQWNRLQSFPETRHTELHYVNFSYNGLTSLSVEMVQKFENLNRIDLGGNDFICCETGFPTFQRWLRDTPTLVYNLGVQRPLKCQFLRNMNEYDISEYVCEINAPEKILLPEKENENIYFITTIVLAVFGLVLIMLLLLFIFFRKKNVINGSTLELVSRSKTKSFRYGSKFTSKDYDDILNRK